MRKREEKPGAVWDEKPGAVWRWFQSDIVFGVVVVNVRVLIGLRILDERRVGSFAR